MESQSSERNSMKRIVFITNSLGFAGAEKMLAFVANSLAQRGHACCVINLNTVGDYINEKKQMLHESISLYTLANKESGCKRRWHTLQEIYGIAKKFHADVLIGFTGFPSLYARLAGLLLGIPSVMSERGDPQKTFSTTWKGKIIRGIINSSAGGVFQTDGAGAFYGKGLQKRGIVIPNPIFVHGQVPDVPFEQREKTVVSVGRLDNEQKRYDVMLDAFRLFSAKYPAYVLKLYGRGSDEALIRQWVEQRSLGDKVRFMGLSTQPMQDICRDGMFLITSDYEGISNSLLEAMAVGLPCVSTDHTPGGARLLIQDRENGLLAPVGDREALANAMCTFAEDAALAKRCGEKAKEVLTRFAPDRIIDLWEQYIVSICK